MTKTLEGMEGNLNKLIEQREENAKKIKEFQKEWLRLNNAISQQRHRIKVKKG